MSFLDNMMDTLTNAGNDLTNKAKEVSGVAKLKLDIKSKEDALSKQYMELGKKYYEMHKEGETPEEDITAISTLINEIADLKEEVLKTQGSCQCPNCGSVLSAGTVFCSKCGAKIQ